MIYLKAHPGQTGRGVPSVAEKWRMQKDMAERGYDIEWLEKYREPWADLYGVGWPEWSRSKKPAR